MPAASVGVARPARIEPSVAPISSHSGTTPIDDLLQRSRRQLWTRSSIGTGGPSFGLMKLRPIR